MGREIKFRTWDKNWEGGEMREFGLGEFLLDEKGRSLNFDTNPVMQFTGLKDKNGVDIYEGDVVETIKHKAIVVFEGSGWKLKHLNHPHKRFWSLPRKGSGLSIVGNIYQP